MYWHSSWKMENVETSWGNDGALSLVDERGSKNKMNEKERAAHIPRRERYEMAL